jgi:RHS repeat-associated protein
MYVYYTYDDENQLVSVYTDTSGTPTSSRWRNDFTYDGRGRLRKRADYTWYTGGSGSWYPGLEVRYLYDGMRVIQERSSGNAPTVAYTRGNDLSASMEGAGGIGGLLARSHGYSGGTFSTHSFYHADGNGNVTYLVNSAQAMAAYYRYDPYGNVLPSGMGGTLASANTYRFSSKEQMPNSGLYYYGYRFYDPNLQRWVNRDPIEEEGGFNLYAMVFNDPSNAQDAFGLQGKEGKPKPPRWNPDEWRAGRENCCAYAYDLPGRAIQPGELGGMPKYPIVDGRLKYTCAELEKRIKADFKNDPNVKGPTDGKCPPGYHKVKPWISKPDERGNSKEYHMQREDEDGGWSDMPHGSGPKRCKPNKPDRKGDTPCDEICVPNAARY